ncbi:hypothetical protein GALL_433670 [mine drainage metagenome]|uniref:Uncharacterized protein n=1 Tax=mine drainage metagenome TaxID=410659 RepID=A0A1J5PU24_9ZZZZ
MRGQVKRHQFGDGNGVGGGPRRDLVAEQEEFRRATAKRLFVDDVDPGIDAARIGLKGCLGLVVLRGDALHGKAVKVETAQQFIGFHLTRAEKL